MASYLRPRRGKKSTADSSAIVLKKGEVFFEIDNNGISTGENAKACGKIKLGNGVTVYSNLGYFIDPNVTCIDFEDDYTATPAYNGQEYYSLINAIEPSATIKSIMGNIKALLFKAATDVTTIKNSSDIEPWTYVGSMQRTYYTSGDNKYNYYAKILFDWRQYDEVLFLDTAQADVEDKTSVAYGSELYVIPKERTTDGYAQRTLTLTFDKGGTSQSTRIRKVNSFVSKESGTVLINFADDGIVMTASESKLIAVYVR